jgi:formylglycine-generating enzyme required for sulfatase activity
MGPRSFCRASLQFVPGMALLCSVALVDEVPTDKRSNSSFVGKEPGQVRVDNELKMKLVWIPPGKFIMGSPKDEKDRAPDEDQVQVTLTKGFWLGQHEVTQAEWRRLMQTTPWSGAAYAKQGDDYAATYVSWDDAIKFSEKFTAQERATGRLPAGWQYTLPTEAQWEYACRTGTTTRFSFGNDDSDLNDYGWWGGLVGDGNAKDEQYAHKVGQRKANRWGLNDMHGNVCEWCHDWYEINLTVGTDPQGPLEGSARVYRGGDWADAAKFCRSAFRYSDDPSNRGGALGFRLAAVPSGK